VNVLIAKLGATGDVVRTTTLLRKFDGDMTWLVEAKNAVVLQGLQKKLRCVPWEERDSLLERSYDLVINLEDTLEVANFLRTLEVKQMWGAYSNAENKMAYTDDSREWFDLSIISKFGKAEADKLKSKNRRTYQELIFSGLGFRFAGETYLLPEPIDTGLSGDVAIATEAGPIWPMKKWAYYDELKRQLEGQGMTVNILPKRSSLLEHLADVQGHRCLVGGDTLPMHLALGSGIPCVTLFTCTSPWEIHGYDLQRKIVSPLLAEFFYKRGFDQRATTAISVDEVLSTVMDQLESAVIDSATLK
jgi:ADP-heptose:LPS heptosyltransferase